MKTLLFIMFPMVTTAILNFYLQICRFSKCIQSPIICLKYFIFADKIGEDYIFAMTWPFLNSAKIYFYELLKVAILGK